MFNQGNAYKDIYIIIYNTFLKKTRRIPETTIEAVPIQYK